MKGKLTKNKEGKWVVRHCCGRCNEIDDKCEPIEYPLHPDTFSDFNNKRNAAEFYPTENKEVEFEIVNTSYSESSNIQYAKLITSPKQEVSEEAKRRTKNLYTPSHKKYIEPKQEESNDLSKVTRLEVIDHSPKGTGRAFVKYDIKELELSYQDDGRTLKIFIK